MKITFICAAIAALLMSTSISAFAARDPVAKCRDGHVSYSHARTCARHGGVRHWFHH